MDLLTAYKKLQSLSPLFLTSDAAAVLEVTPKYASLILSRLSDKDMLVRLARGRWAYAHDVDPLLIPNILTYPMMSYVSLYTALYYHDMIQQVPQTIYSISIAKTNFFKTPLADVSIHHIEGTLFCGYEMTGRNNVMMATPEKALFDILYLIPTRSRKFASLTEVEIPKIFRWGKLEKWSKKIKNKSRRSMLLKAVDLGFRN